MYCFLQWNIQQTKYTLAVKCKLAKLTSDPWETLDDFGNLYKGSLNKPYVSWCLPCDLNLGPERGGRKLGSGREKSELMFL